LATDIVTNWQATGEILETFEIMKTGFLMMLLKISKFTNQSHNII